MKTEFDLSEESFEAIGGEAFYKKDVKEFIMVILDIISNPELSIPQKKAEIKKRAGEKLI